MNILKKILLRPLCLSFLILTFFAFYCTKKYSGVKFHQEHFNFTPSTIFGVGNILNTTINILKFSYQIIGYLFYIYLMRAIRYNLILMMRVKYLYSPRRQKLINGIIEKSRLKKLISLPITKSKTNEY